MEAQRIVNSGYYESRFQYDERREILWKTLCRAYFNKLVKPEDHVLELGAGYANFINNVRCRERTAIDYSPMLKKFADPRVTVRIGSVTDLQFIPDGSVNFVFASNLFEHLSQQDFSAVLTQLKQKLAPGGTFFSPTIDWLIGNTLTTTRTFRSIRMSACAISSAPTATASLRSDLVSCRSR
jgi:ubiquinone/menaquinone biosynthesis C-methylase UbiE